MSPSSLPGSALCSCWRGQTLSQPTLTHRHRLALDHQGAPTNGSRPSSTSRHQPPQEAALGGRKPCAPPPGLGSGTSSPTPSSPRQGARVTPLRPAPLTGQTRGQAGRGPRPAHSSRPHLPPGDELWCSRLEAKAISYHIPENQRGQQAGGGLPWGVPATGIRASPAQQDSGLGNSRALHAWSWQRL